MNKYPEAQKKLDKGKIALLNNKNTTFLTTILFGMQHIFTEDVPTMAVDGLHLFINPDFIMTLDEEEVVFVLGHECWHVAFNHVERLGGLDPKKWNVAGDYVINIMQVDAHMKMPEMGLCDEQYRNMSTRRVYDLLPDPPEDFVMDVITVDKEKDPAKQAAIKEQVKQLLVQAQTAARQAGDDPGSIPGDVERMLYDLVHPVLPWEGLLQEYMQAYQANDYSYRKINKHFDDFFLPKLYSNSLDKLSAVIDISGSILNDQLRAFLSEIKYIQDTMRPNELHVMSFSTYVTANHHIQLGDDIMELDLPHGGCGTRITPVLEQLQLEQPTVAIIFTDMYFEEYTIEPTFDIIWVVIDNPDALIRHGKAIHYDSRRQ